MSTSKILHNIKVFRNLLTLFGIYSFSIWRNSVFLFCACLKQFAYVLICVHKPDTTNFAILSFGILCAFCWEFTSSPYHEAFGATEQLPRLSACFDATPDSVYVRSPLLLFAKSFQILCQIFEYPLPVTHTFVWIVNYLCLDQMAFAINWRMNVSRLCLIRLPAVTATAFNQWQWTAERNLMKCTMYGLVWMRDDFSQ